MVEQEKEKGSTKETRKEAFDRFAKNLGLTPTLTTTEALQKLRDADQRKPFKLTIERVYAPQFGAKKVYYQDPEVSVIKGEHTVVKEGPEKDDVRSVRERSTEKTKEMGIQWHVFERHNGNIRIPFGGAHGLLMGALAMATNQVKGMGYLTPSLRFMRVEPVYIEIPEPEEVPVDFVPEPRGGIDYSKPSKRASMAEIAYEYLADLPEEFKVHKLQVYNSSIAKLSPPEWALVFHAWESINGPPLGRGVYGIEPILDGHQ